MACSPRGAIHSCPRRRCEPIDGRAGRPRHLANRLTPGCGRRDHTILPYAMVRQRPRGRRLCAPCRRHDDATNLTAPFVPTRCGLTGDTPALPACSWRRCRVHRSPARDDDEGSSPLTIAPGWRTHTTIPNFGKAEYFVAKGLTGGPAETSRCFARRLRRGRAAQGRCGGPGSVRPRLRRSRSPCAGIAGRRSGSRLERPTRSIA